jgi:NAD-dependent deacetylase
MDKIRRLAQLIKTSRHCTVFTGAGMSTESGLPDFRSAQGLWKGRDPMRVASVDALYNDLENCQEFYRYRIRNLQKVQPNEGHYILARMQRQGLVKTIVTQNVDGLHRKAGSEDVAELHGTLATVRCDRCPRQFPSGFLCQGQSPVKCPDCGGIIRPNVVLFGEYLPETAWNKACSAVASSDLLLTIGTSLAVSPANQLFGMAKAKGAATALINREDVGVNADIFIPGSAAATLITLAEHFSL